MATWHLNCIHGHNEWGENDRSAAVRPLPQMIAKRRRQQKLLTPATLDGLVYRRVMAERSSGAGERDEVTTGTSARGIEGSKLVIFNDAN